MGNIPKPPKQIKVSPDVRMEYLLEWKRLFEAISPDVTVFLSDPSDEKAKNEFMVKLDSHMKSFQLSGVDTSKYAIFVTRGGVRRSEDLEFLVGDFHERMFSSWDVDREVVTQYQDEGIQDFVPETESWEYWYKYLCDEYEGLHNSIPKPPNP